MSMGSNMMGMQSPAHSSSCSSTHIPTMHSEAKLVSKTQAFTWKDTVFRTHTHTQNTQVHTCKCCNFLFHWAVPAKLRSWACVDFIIWYVIKAVSEPASAALETLAGIMSSLCGCGSVAHRLPDVYLNVQNVFCRSLQLVSTSLTQQGEKIK